MYGIYLSLRSINYLWHRPCRVCVEVMCADAGFTDGYGQYMDRTSACYNTQTSLTLRITDACPCHYPGNQYSNSRWWGPHVLPS